MKFYDLGLNKTLASKCQSLNFTEPTPIQKQTVPIILTGSDLIGCAETGTGKTAAFLLPIIHKLASQIKSGVRVLIIAPTRELVLQIEAVYKQFASKESPCVSLIGGASLRYQSEALRRGASVVIATPGRLIDHLERGNLNLSRIEILTLDEADRMLDMGFLPSIRKILDKLPSKKQTLLFSATMSASVKKLAFSVMNSPKIVIVNDQNKTAVTIDQGVYSVMAASKTALLLNLLETNDYERVIVFTRTKRSAEQLSHIMTARELRANRIHADRSQSQRITALREFREGKIKILVATDIASRGIDVDSVSHVINYDVPETPEDYVHRIGRTGRAGNEGQAITLVSPIEETSLRQIERLIEQPIKKLILPDFGELSFSAKKLGNVFFNQSQGQSNHFIKNNSFRSFGSRRVGR
ncbi:MAG: DEAD/DEAH box helicase [Pyrinomonadaceae bacterium]|nr:DEAD/DEAH box helicase [Pyrinomonadaceae bacterium]